MAMISVLLVLSTMVLPAEGSSAVPTGDSVPVGGAWNFQPAGSPTPEGFVPDSGAPYDPTTGYGWTALDGLNRQCGDRGNLGDPELDTFCHATTRYELRNGTWTTIDSPATWKADLPDGTYEITVTVGESLYHWPSIRHSVQIENTPLITSATTTTTDPFVTATTTIEITDGTLDLSFTDDNHTKIVSLTATPVAPPTPPPEDPPESPSPTVDGAPVDPAAMPLVAEYLELLRIRSADASHFLSGQIVNEGRSVRYRGTDSYVPEPFIDYASDVSVVESSSGKVPAMIGVDFDRLADPLRPDIATAIALDHWSRGGVILLRSEFANPLSGGAATDQGGLDPVSVNALFQDGTPERARWLALIDEYLDGLRLMQDQGLVVLWTPLADPFGSGGHWWDQGHLTDAQYRSLYRDIVERAASAGIHNVLWGWSIQSEIASPLDRYPGDGLVDVVGFSLHRAVGPSEIAPAYLGLQAAELTSRHPVVITEFTPGPSRGPLDTGYDMVDLLNAIRNGMPRVAAVVNGFDTSSLAALNSVDYLRDEAVLTARELRWSGLPAIVRLSDSVGPARSTSDGESETVHDITVEVATFPATRVTLRWGPDTDYGTEESSGAAEDPVDFRRITLEAVPCGTTIHYRVDAALDGVGEVTSTDRRVTTPDCPGDLVLSLQGRP